MNDWLVKEPFPVYLEKSAKYLTSHQLADFCKSPAIYIRKKRGEIPNEDKPEFVFGRALHTLFLEGRDAFDADFIVGGPVNPKTGELYGQQTRAYLEWLESHGKQAISSTQYQAILAMAESIREHPIASRLFAKGLPERVARAEYCNVPCQIRMDWWSDERHIVDIKTCSDLDWFEADARRYGYVNQAAFYQSIVSMYTNAIMPVYVVAIEKQLPYRCGVWWISESLLSDARKRNADAIDRLKHCQAMDTWPTGYEDCRILA